MDDQDHHPGTLLCLEVTLQAGASKEKTLKRDKDPTPRALERETNSGKKARGTFDSILQHHARKILQKISSFSHFSPKK